MKESRRTNHKVRQLAAPTSLWQGVQARGAGKKGEHGDRGRAWSLQSVNTGVEPFATLEAWKAWAWVGLGITMGRTDCRKWGLDCLASIHRSQPPAPT